MIYIINIEYPLRKIINILILYIILHNLFINEHTRLLFEGIIEITKLNIFNINYMLILLYIFNILGPKYKNEKYLILISNIIGIIILIISYDLILLYISIEIINLSLYILIGNNTSGIKYFILSVIISSILFLSIILIYNTYGTFQLDFLYLMKEFKISAGFSLLLMAIFFKLGIFPFHQWSPDLLSGLN